MPEYLAPGVYVEEMPGNNIKTSFEAITLPATELTKLEDFSDHLKQAQLLTNDSGGSPSLIRAAGIAALFSGPSGTGKTMTAEILANRVGMQLYRIDLSQIVNKYIGETEKNLGKVFEKADDFRGILLFDEADALFGKRTDVTDAHDRYANSETGYLLQKIESYKGVVILTTTSLENIDNAFIRRMHTVIEFPLPDTERRINVWARVWQWITRRLLNRHD